MLPRSGRLCVLAVVAFVLTSSQARAATLPFVGAITIQIGDAGAIVIHGAGTATASGVGVHLDTLSIPASAFNGNAVTAPVTDPIAAPVKGLEATIHNAAGRFAPSFPPQARVPLRGVMPLNGLAKACLFKACSANPAANVTVPVSVVGGPGGIISVPRSTPSGFTVRIGAGRWTNGLVTNSTLMGAGFRHGPASATSSTVQNGGAIRFVTPIFIGTSLPALSSVPGMATLDVKFVPEASTLLLLTGGIAGLVMFGRTRRD